MSPNDKSETRCAKCENVESHPFHHYTSTARHPFEPRRGTTFSTGARAAHLSMIEPAPAPAPEGAAVDLDDKVLVGMTIAAMRTKVGELNALTDQQADVLRIEKARADKAEQEVAEVRLALTDTTRQLTEANAEVERLTLELRDATINADESDEIAAELFSLCCAVVDEKPDAAAARDNLREHIEHVQMCRRGSCNTEIGNTPLRARVATLIQIIEEAEHDEGCNVGRPVSSGSDTDLTIISNAVRDCDCFKSRAKAEVKG